MKHLILSFSLATLTLIALNNAPHASASEGTSELRSTTGQSFRCFVSSLLMQDQNYNILVSCRDLLYPAGDNIFEYMLWINPKDGGKAVKLGPLNRGKAQFRTKEAFLTLFVTTELNANVRSPGGNTVMTGTLSPITFLDRPTTPTPTPEGEEGQKAEEEQKPSSGPKLGLAIKRAGAAILLALVAIGGLIFVLTRPRA
ncbi:MAG: hypothetical protein ACC618_01735 [Patescibacteria group bacterium]